MEVGFFPMSHFRGNLVSLIAVKFTSRPVKTICHTSVLPGVLGLSLGLVEVEGCMGIVNEDACR